MKDRYWLLILSIVLALAVVGFYYYFSASNATAYLRAWRDELAKETAEHHMAKRAEVARLTLELAKPYLPQGKYEDYKRRIDEVERWHTKPVFEDPHESYGDLTLMIGYDELRDWAEREYRRQRQLSGKTPDDFLKTTPHGRIVQMHQWLENIHALRRAVGKVQDADELEQQREKFKMYKGRLQEVIVAARLVLEPHECGPPKGCFCSQEGVWVGKDGQFATLDGQQIRCSPPHSGL